MMYLPQSAGGLQPKSKQTYLCTPRECIHVLSSTVTTVATGEILELCKSMYESGCRGTLPIILPSAPFMSESQPVLLRFFELFLNQDTPSVLLRLSFSSIFPLDLPREVAYLGSCKIFHLSLIVSPLQK